MPVGAHAKLGASSTHRWMNCPGSIYLSEDMPNKSSVYAAEGTAAHALTELCLTTKGLEPWELIGQWIDDEGDLFKAGDSAINEETTFEITAEMADAAQMFIDESNRHFEEGVAMDMATDCGYPIMEVEKPFDLSFVRPEMFGTNDNCVFVPTHKLSVLDLKYGAGYAVEVEDNTQLKYYGLGALREMCWDADADDYNWDIMPETVELVIVQPRAPHKDGPIRRWSLPARELVEDFVEELRAAAAAVDEAADTLRDMEDINGGDFPPLNDGNKSVCAGSWCKFCPAKPKCPEIDNLARQTLGTDFDDLDDEDLDDKAKVERGKRIAKDQMDNGQLAQVLRMAPIIESWLKAVQGYALDELKAGREVPGHKLVRKKSNRRWEDKAAAAEQLEMLYDEDQIYKPRELVSFTVIEKLPGGKEIIAGFEEDKIIDKPEGGIAIAEEDDPRPGIDMSAGGDFSDLEEDD